ncbi:MAG: dTMP kinase [Patescibacteria group bacterium]|nr:dTMP kinase [Patescibacteria group bacterium]
MGLFIVFEGVDGSGKTQQSRLLSDHLKRKGYKVLLTKEPGGDDSISYMIRLILLNPDHKNKIATKTELMLFEADRAQHIDRTIMPALRNDEIVISDRFDAATYAYQVYARNVCSAEEFFHLNEFVTNALSPDFTFWLDLDPTIGLKRNANAGKKDRFELEGIEFHRNVREGYIEYFQNIPEEKYAKITTNRPIKKIHEEILQILDKKFKI